MFSSASRRRCLRCRGDRSLEGDGCDEREGLLHEGKRDDDETSPRVCSVAAPCSAFAVASPASPLSVVYSSSSRSAASSVASMPLGSVASMAASASLSVGVGDRERKRDTEGTTHDGERSNTRPDEDNRWQPRTDGERERGGGDGDAGRDSGRSSGILHNRLISSLHRNGSILGVVKRCSASLALQGLH